MIIKKQFVLLKNVPNVLSLSSSDIKKSSIIHGPQNVFNMLDIIRGSIQHYTKDKVYDFISDLKKKKSLNIVYLREYNLTTSYNKPTDSVILNLSPFGAKDISPTNPGSKNLYASLVYGICFRQLVTGKVKMNEKFSKPIIDYLSSLFLRLFGKEYGLLGTYMPEISKLRFLTGCYVLSSFFGNSRSSLYKTSSSMSSFDYKGYVDKLDKYDFSDIGYFIQSLSDLKVMPGINKHVFTAKILKSYTFEFLPALEDLSRFISILTTSEITGSTIVPTYLSRVNQKAFERIISLSETIFRRR